MTQFHWPEAGLHWRSGGGVDDWRQGSALGRKLKHPGFVSPRPGYRMQAIWSDLGIDHAQIIPPSRESSLNFLRKACENSSPRTILAIGFLAWLGDKIILAQSLAIPVILRERRIGTVALPLVMHFAVALPANIPISIQRYLYKRKRIKLWNREQ
jgi:hypothetical protein